MIQLKCKKHPRYSAQLPPKASCQPCISLYEIVIKNRELVVLKKPRIEPEEIPDVTESY